jgi:hypothetical protein
MKTNERWKPIPSVPGYEASSLGNIRLISTRYIRHATTVHTGRRCLPLHGKTMNVAPLVLEAFSGPRPSPTHQAVHLNGKRSDDRSANLRWLSREAAIRLAHKRPRPQPTRHGRLSPKEQKEVLRLNAKGLSQVNIAAKIGCHDATVSRFLDKLGARRNLKAEMAARHRAALLVALKAIPTATMEQLLPRLDCTTDTARRHLTRMVAQGLVTVKRRGRECLWTLKKR